MFKLNSCPLHLLQVEPLFLEAEHKNKLLRSVAGGGVEQLVELRTRWDKFEIMMESQKPMIQDDSSNITLSVRLSREGVVNTKLTTLTFSCTFFGTCLHGV